MLKLSERGKIEFEVRLYNIVSWKIKCYILLWSGLHEDSKVTTQNKI